jgi:hypothetical protein
MGMSEIRQDQYGRSLLESTSVMASTELIEQLRRELPRLLREHPEVRHELWGMMLEAFPSRQEFMGLLEELRAPREDSNRRFRELNLIGSHENGQLFIYSD